MNVPTLKNDLSDPTFIKYDIFEVTVTFTPKGTPIGISDQYYDNQNMSYVSQSTKNSPHNRTLPARNKTNLYILSIGRK